MDVDILGHRNVHEFWPEIRRGLDVRTRDNVFFDDPLLGVDILEKKVEGGDPLGEAPLQRFPFISGDDPGE